MEETSPNPKNVTEEKQPAKHLLKKSWKTFLTEFFMIFLAVTLGFFAEQYRTDLTNCAKEKNYMVSMVNNLKNDTAQLSGVIVFQNYLITKMDAALSIPVYQLGNYDVQDTFFSNFIWFSNWFSTFSPNDNTLVQLRNAGGFSLIQKDGVPDSITAYYSDFNTIDLNQDYYHSAYNAVQEKAINIIRYPLSTNISDPVFYSIPVHEEKFIAYDYVSVEAMYNLIRIEEGDAYFIIGELKEHKQKAERLIAFLKKEYDIK